MEILKKNAANLLKVKTIVTLLLTIVFCALALTGTISGADFLTVFTVVIAFYFGTQSEKTVNAAYTGPQQSEAVQPVIDATVLTQGTVDSATANEVHPPDSEDTNDITATGFAG